jgi:hypothetical protein
MTWSGFVVGLLRVASGCLRHHERGATRGALDVP